MAKKKNSKKQETPKLKTAKSLKNVKTSKRADERNLNKSSSNEMKKFGTILLYIVLIVAVFYLITVFMVDGSDSFFGNKDKGSNTDKDGNTKVDEEIDYSIIAASSTFNSAGDEYYVLFYDMSNDDNSNLTAATKLNAEKKVYKVDLSKAINKAVKSDSTNPAAQSIEELKVKDPTLIKVSNGKNVLYLENFQDIIKELK